MKVKIVNKSSKILPNYSTEFSTGLDLRANIDEDILLKSLDRVLIPTGLFIQLLGGVEAQVRQRSGLALKHGISKVNTPGTIDSDYRGEIGEILIKLSKDDFVVKNGDRICQMIIDRHENIEWEEVDNLEVSARGEGGFGHTGNK